jgi:hypothetical protein
MGATREEGMTHQDVQAAIDRIDRRVRMAHARDPWGGATYLRDYYQKCADQRALAAQLFPALDTSDGWRAIMARVVPHQDQYLAVLLAQPEIPSEWAFWWGYLVGNRDIMRHHVLEPIWAFEWGFLIGDREQMLHLVTESEAAYCWGHYIGDRDIVRARVTDPYWIDQWQKYVEPGPAYSSQWRRKEPKE